MAVEHSTGQLFLRFDNATVNNYNNSQDIGGIPFFPDYVVANAFGTLFRATSVGQI